MGYKKLWITLLCMITAAISVSASSFGWTYEIEERELSVNREAVQNEFLSLSVIPYREVLSEELVNQGKALLKTIESKNNRIAASIVLPDSWTPGRYELLAEGKRNCFLIVKKGFGSAAAVVKAKTEIFALLNAANGFSEGASEPQKDKIAAAMSNYVPDGGYDTDTFVRQYMTIEGLVMFQENIISTDELLEWYALYLHGEVSEEEKNSFSEALMVYKGTPKNMVEEVKLLARIRTGNKAVFEKETTEHIEAAGLSNGNYTLLNSYYKNELWDSLYTARLSYTSFEDVYNAFVSEAIEQYSAQKKSEGSFETGNSGGGNGGGSRASVTDSYKPTVTEQKYFSDMSGHWAEQQVENLAKRGIVSGFRDGSFKPEQAVTRAEFTKMLVCMLGLAEEKSDDFADVKEDDWFSGVVGAAYRVGIVMGNGGFFNPNELISRQDVAVMIYRFLKHYGMELSGNAYFVDSAKISDYAREAVQVLAENGVITGYDNSFCPEDAASRAEAAVMIGRADGLRKG